MLKFCQIDVIAAFNGLIREIVREDRAPEFSERFAREIEKLRRPVSGSD